MPGLKLVAELGGDGSGYDAMMRRANQVKDRFSQSFAGLKNVIAGAFTVGAITQLSRKTIEFASHLRDVSDALRVNVEWFQKRANAARLAGGTEDDLFRFIDTMTKSRAAAVQQPGGPESDAFTRLGINAAAVQNLNTMEFFDRIVAAFGDGANAQTTVDVEKVGGRSARNLLAAFANQFQSDSKIMSEQMVNDLDDIGDQFTILGNLLLIEFAPAIIGTINAIRGALNFLKLVSVGAAGGLYAATHGGSFSEGMDRALSEEAANQAKAEDERKNARLRAQELRRRRESAPPGFEPLEIQAKEAGGSSRALRTPQVASDALVGIGNFLGRNTALVNNVAAQHLEVSRRQLTATYSVRDSVVALGVKLAAQTSGATLGIPL